MMGQGAKSGRPQTRRGALKALAGLLAALPAASPAASSSAREAPEPGVAQSSTRRSRKRVAICTFFAPNTAASHDARRKRWSEIFARHGMVAADVEITIVTPKSADFIADAAEWTAMARQVVASRPDVILLYSVWLHIFGPLTNDIPIVFVGMIDPEHHKYIASARRPGGNVTGALDPFFEIQEKRIALLAELRPAARRIALVWHSGGPYAELIERTFKGAAQRLGLEPCVVGLPQDSPELIGALQACHAEMVDFIWTCDVRPALFGQLAKLGIASSFACGISAVRAGGLLSYVPIGALAIALGITARILRGESVATIPAEQVREYRFALNLRTAKALGIAVPQAILIQANDVIQ